MFDFEVRWYWHRIIRWPAKRKSRRKIYRHRDAAHLSGAAESPGYLAAFPAAGRHQSVS
jgi:hypothetical protein